MKKIIYLALPLAFLMACGDKKASEETVKLETFKDRLSYALGAEQSKMVTESGDPNLARLKFDKIAEGFAEGLKSEKAFGPDCEQTIQKLYGPQGQDFDTNYLDAGCICTGKFVGSMFLKEWKKRGVVDKIDFEKAKIGFKHALEKRDTLIKMEDRTKMINDFVIDLNKKQGAAMLEKAKKLPNVQVLPSGLVIQTIQAGTGGSPTPTDDIQVDYILTSALGDTIQSSFDYKKQTGKEIPAFNIAGDLIEGWKIAFPLLKKGGKYKLFIPAELAYGAKKGFESLCFYIEFNNYGKGGTLAEPKPAPGVQQ